jgi:hypothetical protein
MTRTGETGIGGHPFKLSANICSEHCPEQIFLLHAKQIREFSMRRKNNAPR